MNSGSVRPEDRPTSTGTRAIEVLLIEDNPGDAALMREFLSEVGSQRYAIDWVRTLREGIDLLSRRTYDLLLLDLSLPDGHGLETLRRTLDVAVSLPIVVLTGLDDEEIAVQAVHEGAQDYLAKNKLDGDPLIRTIRYAIERSHTSRALRESQERFALAARGAQDVLWDWDLRTGEIYFSPRWGVLIGEGEIEREGTLSDWLDRVHPADRPELERRIHFHLEGALSTFEHEHRIQDGGGRYRWILCRGRAARAENGRPYRFAGWLTDINDRRDAEERARREALHDRLTGLANRDLLRDLLHHAIGRMTRRCSYRFAVLFLDLDRFKVINDTRGHAIGDELLVSVARSLERCLRPQDSVARLGGDEFAVMLDGIRDAGDAIRVAERIQNEISRPVDVGGSKVFTSISIGIAVGSPTYRSPEEIIRDADIAMYRAKTQGGARFEVFDRQVHAQAVSLLELETDFRPALERGEFCLHYQPIVELPTRAFSGFEALVRWQHPTRGLLLPSAFIPLAEETGLIVPLGLWVMEEAGRQVRQWEREFGYHRWLRAHVNVSWRQLAEPSVVGDVERALERSGLSPERFCLEMTESVAVQKVEASREKLARLRELGVHIHIDDFGTGYSSLSYLHQVPADTIKIDRAFVAGIEGAGNGYEILRSIVAVARNLGMQVTAEGVETEEQFRQLKALSCDQGQGFLFHRPANAKATGELIRSVQAA